MDLDLASYSEKSLFPGEPKIRFVADDKVVYTTAAQFLTSKRGFKLFSESVSLKVPYAAFRRLTAGKKMTLKVGDHEYNFRDEQWKPCARLRNTLKTEPERVVESNVPPASAGILRAHHGSAGILPATFWYVVFKIRTAGRMPALPGKNSARAAG